MIEALRLRLESALNTIDNTAYNEKIKMTAYYNRLIEKEEAKKDDGN